MINEITYREPGFAYMIAPALKNKKHIVDKNIDIIFNIVCDFYGISKEDILGKRRYRNICICRHAIVFCLKRYTALSLKKIGNVIGGRDHTTCLQSIRTITGWMQTEDKMFTDIKTIERKILEAI